MMTAGFEPNVVIVNSTHMAELISDCEKLAIWDERSERVETGDALLLSPWGFRWLKSTADFDAILQPPLIDPNKS
jgi:hypothetical protein